MTDFERGAEAMREAAVEHVNDARAGYLSQMANVHSLAKEIANLPLPVQPPGSEPVPFTEERRAAAIREVLTGGNVPLPGTRTPEELAQHVEAMVCSFWMWPGQKESPAEMVFKIALGALRRMQELSAPGSESREASARASLDAAIGLLEEIDPYKEGCPLKFNGKHSGGTIVSVLIHAKEARRALAPDARIEEKK